MKKLTKDETEILIDHLRRLSNADSIFLLKVVQASLENDQEIPFDWFKENTDELKNLYLSIMNLDFLLNDVLKINVLDILGMRDVSLLKTTMH